MPENNANSIPAIRTFQFQAPSSGDFQKSVNLFRGDVNLSQKLISLPGRPGSGEMDVDISVLCQSNVKQSVTTRNLEAPTGILGVGWSLPFDRIVVDTGATAAQATNNYFLLSGGGSNRLIPSGPDQGGVRIFELENYEFWNILYDPTDERWEITKDNGITYTYGGGKTTTSKGFNSSDGNSVEWGVCWGNWIGSSAVTSGQQQYATAWNLRKMSDRYGDQVLYDYNGWARDSQSGLIPVVEQQVGGSGGKPYTKACYITGITDIFGRQVSFSYANKQYSSGAGDPREYEDPHKQLQAGDTATDLPGNLNTPNAYQDRYETKYLTAISVNNSEGDLLLTQTFTYFDPLVNVNDTYQDAQYPPTLYGDTYKRYLKAITQSNGQGQSQPSFQFTYCWDSSNQEANWGALESMTYPEGATGTFNYGYQSLPICSREKTLSPPSQVSSATATPKVWFGPDYAVVTWYNGVDNQLALNVYTWTGAWQQWPDSHTDPVIFDNGIDANGLDLGTLNVIPHGDNFALTFSSTTKTYLYLYHREPQKSAQWLAYNHDQPSQPAYQTYASTNVSFAGGDQFIAINALVGSNYQLDRFHWDWSTQTWIEDSNLYNSSNPLFLTSGREYYLTMAYNPSNGQGTLNLNYLDSLGNWQVGPSSKTVNLNLLILNFQYQFQWSGGPSMAAAAITTAKVEGSYWNYNIQIFQWDEQYNFTDVNYSQTPSFRQVLSRDTADRPISPVILGNSMVASDANLLRFDSQTWQVTTSLDITTTPISNGRYWFAYGDDFAVRTINTATKTLDMVAFDPNQPGSWSSSPLPLPLPPGTPDNQLTAYFPTASGNNFFTSGTNVYYRGNSTDWVSPSQSPIYTIPGQIDSTSVIDEAPGFIGYLLPDPSDFSNSKIDVLILKNGLVEATESLSGVQYTSSANIQGSGNGQYPAGPGSFVSYTLSNNVGSFNQATEITLNRFAGYSIKNDIEHYPVEYLDLFDGDQTHYQTAYVFNPTTAACDPSGTVVKYYTASVFPGCQSAQASQFGRSVHTYINGIVVEDPDHQATMLDGYPLKKIDFEGAFLTGTSFNTNLGLSVRSGNPTGLTSSLRTVFSNAGVSLSSAATIQWMGEDQYWLVDDPNSGEVFNITYNGIDTDSDGVKIFSGKVVAFSQQGWTLFTKRNSNATTADANPINLFGGYTKQTNTVQSKDGLTTSSVSSYVPDGFTAPFSGQELTVTSDSYNSLGELESHVTEKVYAYQKYTEVLDLNILVAAVQETKLAGGTAFKCDVQTWRSDPTSNQWAPYQAFTARSQSAANSGFNFSTSTSPNDNDWLLVNSIDSRTNKGLEAERANADGLNQVTLYDQKQRVPVAVFTNAQAEECSYYGFEDYEDEGSWSIGSNTVSTSGQAHTGNNSLQMNPSTGGSLSSSFNFTVSDQKPIYVLSCWIRTQEGFGSDSGTANWNISVNGTSFQVAVEDSGETWQYLYIPIDVSSLGAGANAQVTVSLTNQKTSTYLMVDNLRFSPLNSNFQGVVYDTYAYVPIAKLGSNGECSRKIYNSFQQSIGSTNSSDEAGSFTQSYFSRDGYQNNNGYTATDPNAALSMKARSGGSLTLFNDGPNQWQNVWQPTNSASWSVNQQALHFQAPGSGAAPLGRLTYQPMQDLGNFAFSFNLQDPSGSTANLSQPLGVQVGDNLKIQWNPGGGWQLYKGSVLSASLSADQVAQQWLVVVSQNGVLFYGDGQQIFANADFSSDISGSLSLFLSDSVALRNFWVGLNPVTQVSYHDGTGKKIQVQSLAGSAISASGTLYDTVHREFLNTKPMIYQNTSLGYKTTLVSGFDTETGVLSGDINNYYPNDQGYPYESQRFEASPLNRPIEKGSAGADFAIAPGNTHTVSMAYGVNQSGDWTQQLQPPLPAGQYALETTIDQNGTSTAVAKDAMGLQVAVHNGPTTHGGSQYLISSTQYDNAGRPVQSLLPNQYSGQGGKSDWMTTQQYNFLGLATQTTSVDTGTTLYFYDKGGRVRFLQDARGQAEGYFLYTTYDVFGRPLEKGVSTSSWSQLTQDQADNDSFAPASSTVRKTHAYDGTGMTLKPNPSTYGGAPYLIGRSQSASTYNQGQTDAVVDTYQYDLAGNVVTKGLSIDSESQTLYETGYAYDSIKNITRIDYPSAKNPSSEFSLYYNYSFTGKIIGIGTDAHNPTDIATYTYNALGKPENETLNGENSQHSLTRVYSYNSPGWLKSIDDDLFQETLSYTNGGYQGAAYYNGNPAQISYQFKGNGTPGNYNYSYQYDPLGRLQVAQNSLDDTWSIGTGSGNQSTYDHNGNLLTLDRGGQPENFTYNYDQLMNTDGSQNNDYQYDANGNLTNTPQRVVDSTTYQPLTLVYDQYLNLTSTATSGGSTTQYLYNEANQRVFKDIGSTSSKTLYLHGMNPSPLITWNGVSETRYFYGPQGLVALQQTGDTNQFVLKDHQGSVRLLFDASDNTTATASWDYLPLGDLMRSTNGNKLAYRFTGQEFDPETGLYNYRSRLYDCQLGRFYETDPQAQFSSPYVYAGNNPVLFIDPSGELSNAAWGGIISGAEIVLGVGIIVMTGGTVGTVIGAALIGAGISGAVYSATHTGKDFSWVGFIEADAKGAATGAITGGFGAAASAMSAGMSIGAAIATETGMGVAAGFVSSVAGQSIQAAYDVADGASVSDALGNVFSLSGLIGDVAGIGLGATGGIIGGSITGFKTFANQLGKLSSSLERAFSGMNDTAEPLFEDLEQPGLAAQGSQRNYGSFSEANAQPPGANVQAAAKPSNKTQAVEFLFGKSKIWVDHPRNWAGRLPKLIKPALFNLKKVSGFWS